MSLVSCPHPLGITKLFGGLIDQTIPCAAVLPIPCYYLAVIQSFGYSSQSDSLFLDALSSIWLLFFGRGDLTLGLLVNLLLTLITRHELTVEVSGVVLLRFGELVDGRLRNLLRNLLRSFLSMVLSLRSRFLLRELLLVRKPWTELLRRR